MVTATVSGAVGAVSGGAPSVTASRTTSSWPAWTANVSVFGHQQFPGQGQGLIAARSPFSHTQCQACPPLVQAWMRLATAARAAGEQSTCVKRAPTCRARRSSRARTVGVVGSSSRSGWLDHSRSSCSSVMKSASTSGLGTVCGGLSASGPNHGPVHLARGEVKNQFLGCRRHEARGHLGQQARHAVVLRHSDGLNIGRIEQGPRSGGSASQSCAVMSTRLANRRRRSATDSPASQSSRRGSRIEQPTKTTGRVRRCRLSCCWRSG